jgi:hypothetical protein
VASGISKSRTPIKVPLPVVTGRPRPFFAITRIDLAPPKRKAQRGRSRRAESGEDGQREAARRAPAGKGQASEQSAYDVFRYNGMPVTPAPVKGNDIETRIEAVAFALNDNPRGVNQLVISPLCRTLIVGTAGRYHLVREEDGELRPKKDKYSNLCDCLQYGCLSLGEGRRMIGLRNPSRSLPPA